MHYRRTFFGPASSGRTSKWLATLAVAIGISSLSAAQSFTNVPVLNRLASEAKIKNVSEQLRSKAWAQRVGFPAIKRGDNGQILVLKGWEFNRPTFLRTWNREAAKMTGVDALWPGGSLALTLTGNTKYGGSWEPGGIPEVSHREFTGRVTNSDSSPGISDHATHTVGTMIAAGIDPDAKGMAYQGKIHAYDTNNSETEIATASGTGMTVSNHSYGSIAGFEFGLGGQFAYYWLGDPAVSTFEDYAFGFYDFWAAYYDNMAYNGPFHTLVMSAGNERNPGVPSTAFDHYIFDSGTGQWTLVNAARYDQSTYDTISYGFSLSKNVLTVGAVEKLTRDYSQPSDVVMSSFSSWGPTDDGRIKPDICAIGVGVYSSVSGNGYDTYDGTSMSAPNTSGAVILLQEYYEQLHAGQKMRSSMVKALLTHTAKECGNTLGPDYAFGFGLLDAKAAAEKITAGAYNNVELNDYTLNTGSVIDIPLVVESGTIKATIAWIDPAGQPQNQAELDNRTPRLVNDIDIRLIRNSDGQVFRPWILDPANPAAAAITGDNIRDNVEQVYLAGAAAGTYTLRISGKGALKPAGSQIVSAVVTAPFLGGLGTLDIVPSSVIGGVDSATATLKLTNPAAQDTPITLSSSNTAAASVPASVIALAGESEVRVPITTYSVRPLPGQQSVTVSIVASSPLGVKGAQFEVLPVTVDSVDFAPAEVVGGNFVTGTLTLNGPAPKNGAAILLTSDQTNVARPIRNWVVIPAGQTSTTFRIKTFAVTAPSSVTFTATRFGAETYGTLDVVRAALSTVSATPGSPFAGQNVKITVALDGIAPAGGATIQLSSSDSTVLSLPASVSIGAGKRTAVVNATALRSGQVTITASRLNVVKNITITVKS